MGAVAGPHLYGMPIMAGRGGLRICSLSEFDMTRAVLSHGGRSLLTVWLCRPYHLAPAAVGPERTWEEAAGYVLDRPAPALQFGET